MRTYISKAILVATSVILILSVSSAKPEIEDVKPWPSDLSHEDYLYADAEITGSSGIDAWFEVRKDGERIGRGTLSDSNDDSYYVSSSGVKVDGGEKYRVEVTACADAEECATETTAVKSECSLSVFGNCIR